MLLLHNLALLKNITAGVAVNNTNGLTPTVDLWCSGKFTQDQGLHWTSEVRCVHPETRFVHFQSIIAKDGQSSVIKLSFSDELVDNVHQAGPRIRLTSAHAHRDQLANASQTEVCSFNLFRMDIFRFSRMWFVQNPWANLTVGMVDSWTTGSIAMCTRPYACVCHSSKHLCF